MQLTPQQISDLFLSKAPFTDLVGLLVYMSMLLEYAPEIRLTVSCATMSACWLGDTAPGREMLLGLYLPSEILTDPSMGPDLLLKANELLQEYQQVMKATQGKIPSYFSNL